VIHEANTDAARHEVLDFFLAAFDDIDPNAVPTTVHDDLYARSWCNSAIRTAGGCWAPPSPAAHRSLPVRRDEEAWRVITAGAHAASTANTRQQTERLYVGPSLQLRWAAAEQKPGSYSEDMCDTRIRQVLRYSCVSVTVGDMIIPKPAGASRHRKHTFTPDTTAGTQITSTTIRARNDTDGPQRNPHPHESMRGGNRSWQVSPSEQSQSPGNGISLRRVYRSRRHRPVRQ